VDMSFEQGGRASALREELSTCTICREACFIPPNHLHPSAASDHVSQRLHLPRCPAQHRYPRILHWPHTGCGQARGTCTSSPCHEGAGRRPHKRVRPTVVRPQYAHAHCGDAVALRRYRISGSPCAVGGTPEAAH
jgi:hypothetical protein